VGGALVYEEPIYIQAAGTTGGTTSGSYPVLKRVAVSFNGNVGSRRRWQKALSQVIPGWRRDRAILGQRLGQRSGSGSAAAGVGPA